MSPSFLLLLGQLSPTALEAIKQGGPVGVIVILVLVILYRERELNALHTAIHTRDKDYADKLAALEKEHTEKIAAVMEAQAKAIEKITVDRIGEMVVVTKAALALDNVLRSVDTLGRGARRS